MTEILLQSALSESKSAQLASDAARIRERCAAEHGSAAKANANADANTNTNTKSNSDGATTTTAAVAFVECAECFETLVEAVRARYLASPDAEWFSPRRVFLQELDGLFADAKQRRAEPRAVDDRIREERGRWYAENVRASLLRLMVEDPSGRAAVVEKLEDAPANPAGLALQIAKILSESPLLSPKAGLERVPEGLSAAEGLEARIEVLREAFFGTTTSTAAAAAGGDGQQGNSVAADQKYVGMLRAGLPMEQVVDRILEERQAAVASRERTEELKQRLHDLRRGRAAHEAQKSKKESKRARLAEQRRQQVDVPDELYELQPCLSCSKVPETADFLCCPICAILYSWKAQEAKPAVYCCAEHNEPRDHPRHATAHVCSSGNHCLAPEDGSQAAKAATAATAVAAAATAQQQQQPKPPPSSSSSSAALAASHKDDSASLVFCRECLTSLKIPTTWCSAACADANFQRHREEVHLPARKRLGLVVTDRDQLAYSPPPSDDPEQKTRYRAKDIGAHVIPYLDAARQWEERTHVKLQKGERPAWARA